MQFIEWASTWNTLVAALTGTAGLHLLNAGIVSIGTGRRCNKDKCSVCLSDQ